MDSSSAHYYRLIDHTADLGMEIFGEDPEALFANAARALFAVLVSDSPAAEAERQARTIDLEGADWADLMVNWLRELLYLWNGEQQVLCRIAIRFLTEHHLRATVGTGDFIPGRHGIDHEIKAVTYHQIQVGPEGNGWRARVIFDV